MLCVKGITYLRGEQGSLDWVGDEASVTTSSPWSAVIRVVQHRPLLVQILLLVDGD